MLGKCSTTELHPQYPFLSSFLSFCLKVSVFLSFFCLFLFFNYGFSV